MAGKTHNCKRYSNPNIQTEHEEYPHKLLLCEKQTGDGCSSYFEDPLVHQCSPLHLQILKSLANSSVRNPKLNRRQTEGRYLHQGPDQGLLQNLENIKSEQYPPNLLSLQQPQNHHLRAR